MNGKWKISNDPKKICFITIIIVALGGLLWYFRPLPLSNLANDSIQILATEIEYVVKDDMAYHNVTNYTEISDVQKNEIQALFENYSYKRTLGTLFSDGSLDGFFNKVPQFIRPNQHKQQYKSRRIYAEWRNRLLSYCYLSLFSHLKLLKMPKVSAQAAMNTAFLADKRTPNSNFVRSNQNISDLVASERTKHPQNSLYTIPVLQQITQLRKLLQAKGLSSHSR